MSESELNPSPELELCPTTWNIVVIKAGSSYMWICCVIYGVIFGLAVAIPPFKLSLILKMLAGGPVLLGCLFYLRTQDRLQNQHRLLLNAKGISWHYGWFTIESSWDNVESLGSVRIGLNHVLGLKLREPGQLSYTGPAWLKPKELKALPLKPFTLPQNLPEVLRHYAPNLDLSDLPAALREFADQKNDA